MSLWLAPLLVVAALLAWRLLYVALSPRARTRRRRLRYLRRKYPMGSERDLRRLTR